MIPNDFKYSKDFIKVKRGFMEIITNITPKKNYGSFTSKKAVKNICG